MDPNTLPRAIALQFDTGEIVYPAGGQPVSRAYSYTGSELRCSGKTTDCLDDPPYRRGHARGWAGGGKKTRHIEDNRWIVHVALWAASQAARLPGDFRGMRRRYRSDVAGDLRLARVQPAGEGFLAVRHVWRHSRRADDRGGRNGIGGWHNREAYEECFAQATANFAPWPRCRLVRGMVPDTLAEFPADRRVA